MILLLEETKVAMKLTADGKVLVQHTNRAEIEHIFMPRLHSVSNLNRHTVNMRIGSNSAFDRIRTLGAHKGEQKRMG